MANMKITSVYEKKKNESKPSEYFPNAIVSRDQIINGLSLWTLNRTSYHDKNNNILNDNDMISNSYVLGKLKSTNVKLKAINQEVFSSIFFDFIQFFYILSMTHTEYGISKFKQLPFLSKDIIEVVDNLIKGDATTALEIFNSTIENQTNSKSQIYNQLSNLQLIFGLTKNLYSRKTLNYKVYDIVQNKIIELMSLSDDKTKQTNLINEIKKMLSAFVSTRRKLLKYGIENNAVIEDTEKKIGRLKLFQIK